MRLANTIFNGEHVFGLFGFVTGLDIDRDANCLMIWFEVEAICRGDPYNCDDGNR